MNDNPISRRRFLQGVTAGTTGAAITSLPAGAAPAEATGSAASPRTVENFPRVEPGKETETAPVSLNIVTAERLLPQTLAKLQQFSQVSLKQVANKDELHRQIESADALFGRFHRKTLRAAKKLKWIQYTSAGVEKILWPELVSGPVVLTNMQRIYAPGIAETAMALLLALSRRIDDYVRQTDRHQWNGLDAVEVGGSTMGLVGLGGIGSTIAYHAHYGFGMTILATDAKPLPQPPFAAELREPAWLPEMIPQCDVLVSAAPHTPVTEKMFDAKVFRRMKKTAFFLNMSRGKLVDTPALVRALNEGWIAGAGIDVTHQEPLPAEEPLWSARNVIITSHASGSSPQRRGRVEDLFVENVRRYVSRLPLLNVVDKERGY